MTPSTQSIGNVREVDITDEMQVAYLDYAMSVIVARALPDVRDGLKPVHRRILYAMHDLGLHPHTSYKKSARIVGEVLGKYHPHSDTAVYDAMVRLAQDFSMRYPLVDGQGNFGSIDGDNAAAMRYTEARLSPISDLVLNDLEKDTIDWTDNFDNTLREPTVLPSALPNLLINGSSGIAVGMATSIPPHNLTEIINASVHLIDNYPRLDDISVEELMRFVNGPDFPTGGIIYRFRTGSKGEENIDAIAQGYATGRARLIVQAKAHFEEMSRSRSRIVVTELPYQTNKTNLLERIATLVRDSKLEGITDLRDESDRTGMRIVIELTRNAEPKLVLADLFKYTPMQQTFGMSMLALVDGEPRTLGLKRMLHLFIEHRREIVRRRSEYDLARAQARAHIVEGLLRALDILDEVIETIRRSQRVETARNNLMNNFKFSEVQAQAILDMPLKRLAALERKRLQEEYDELQKLINYLQDLLAHPEKILGVIRQEMLDIRERHGDRRRSQIVERTKGTLTTTDLLPDQKVWISVGDNGEIRRQAFAGISSTSLRQAGANAATALLTANTRDQLYLFATDGRCRRVGIHEIPQDVAKHAAELTDLTRRDGVAACLALPRLTSAEATGYLFLVTVGGSVKRISLADFMGAAGTDPDVMRVESKDKLGWVFPTTGEAEVIFVTARGQSIRFREEDVRSMGLAAGGVGGMKVKKGDQLVAACVADPSGELVTVTAEGYCKRTSLDEYSVQGRNGGGIVAHKLTARTGFLSGAAVVTAESEFVTFVTAKGIAKPTAVADVALSGRSTQGQQTVKAAQGDQIAGVQVVSRITDALDEMTTAAPAPDETTGKPVAKTPPKTSPKPPRGTGDTPSRANGAAGRRTTRTSPATKPATQPSDTPSAKKAKDGTAKPEATVKPKRRTRGSASTAETSTTETSRTTEAKPARRTRTAKTTPVQKAPAKTVSSPEPTKPTRSRKSAPAADEPIQPSLLGDDAPSPAPAKRKPNKVARVSSVTPGQKKGK
ncbi:MAG: DNA gyrase subunit A [Caldilineaceae bacterium]|nr:DNA gyrase subunit A [Caldilineaceae bacterium]